MATSSYAREMKTSELTSKIMQTDGQANLSRDFQIVTAVIDTAGLCLFVAFPVSDNPDAYSAILDMINAKYGLSMSEDDLLGMGKKVLTMEREFNNRAGFTPADDRLPEFFQLEKLPPHDQVFDVPNADLDGVYDFAK